MKTRYIFSFIFIISVLPLEAQQFTLNGYIQDKATGEKLIGANVFCPEIFSGTTTNSYGFYSITLPAGKYKIICSYVGYSSFVQNVTLDSNINLDINLEPSLELDEVTVSSERNRTVESTQMSTIHIPVKQIKKIPALLGEVDLIKAIQLLPGVQSGTEGASGLYVRGGGPDQNLILLDGTPVYNVSHLFGFFSVFNTDAVNNIELIKGGFPARYGGRLSSVLDISLKEGNMKKIKGAGSLGLISAKFTIEGPVVKDKTSFIISARRTYLDYLVQPFIRTLGGEDPNTAQGYFFYDLNAKINHKFSFKDRLYLSVYTGTDKFYRRRKPYTYLYDGVYYSDESRSNLGWGNITSALRWNHQFSGKLFSNTTFTYSHYDFHVKDFSKNIVEYGDSTTSEINSLRFLSGIDDFTAKVDFDFLPSPDHFARFGINHTYHIFKPGASVFKITGAETGKIDTTLGEKNIPAWEYYAYIEDDYKISRQLKINAGLHYSGFLVNRKYYNALQPRLAVRYMPAGNWSVKASYAMMQQYIHLLTNNNIGLPTDLWVPATDKILPQQSHQVAVGISKSFGDMFQLEIEGYYKAMNHIIEYKDGASFMGTYTGWEDKVEMGKGWSYGGEIFFEKKIGKLTGWLGYTLSWTNRKFETINNGRVFPYKYDRRHDISLVANFPLNEKWDFSASWVYGTGTAHTLPTERYLGNGGAYYYDLYYPGSYGQSDNGNFSGEVQHVDARNSLRAADYHRLDVSFRKTTGRKWGKSIWTLGVYNLYNRKNPFYYYIGRDERGNRALRRVTLFPLIPSVSWSFTF